MQTDRNITHEPKDCDEIVTLMDTVLITEGSIQVPVEGLAQNIVYFPLLLVDEATQVWNMVNAAALIKC